VISTRWLDRRTPYWQRLEALVDRTAAHGLHVLTRPELQELGLLYRQAAADLATVREDPASIRVAASLNRLLARAHHTIYSAERPTASGIWQFVAVEFPRTFRAHVRYCFAAFALFLVAAGVGAVLTAQDPEFKTKLLAPQMIETIDRHQMWTQSIVSIKPVASSQIMTNNISVTFMAFALGVTGGLGTIYLMLMNGLLIGVVATTCALAGMSVPLWSFIAPHGVIELPAIFIAGGAGLRLGEGILFPGVLPRRESVARAGAEAIRLILGCIPLLVVAGLIEAFVSPTDLAVPLKFAMAGSLFTLLTWYLLRRQATVDRLSGSRHQ